MTEPAGRGDGSLIDVVAAVVLDRGEYLACRRRPDKGGKWEFPGGKVELGEDHSTALAREIREELGVEVRVGECIASVRDPGLGIQLTSYAATLVSDRPVKSSDHDILLWIPMPALGDLDWSSADSLTVKALR